MTPDDIFDRVRLACSILAAVLSFMAPWSTEHRIRPTPCFSRVFYAQVVLTWGNMILLWAQPLAPIFPAYHATCFSIATLFQLDGLSEDSGLIWNFFAVSWALGVNHEMLEIAIQLSPGIEPDSWRVIRITLAVSKFASYLYLLYCFAEEKGTKTHLRKRPPQADAILQMCISHFKVFKQFIWIDNDDGMRRRFIISIVLRLCQNALCLWLPLSISRLMRELNYDKPYSEILPYIIQWSLLRLLQSPGTGLPSLDEWNWLKVIFHRQQKLKQKIFAAIMNAGFSYHRKQSRAAITTAIDNAQGVDQSFDAILRNALDGCFAIFIALPVTALRFGSSMLIIAAFFLSVSVIIFRRSTTKMFRARADVVVLHQRQRQQCEDAIQGWTTSALFGQTGYHIHENDERLEEFHKISWKFYVSYFISNALNHTALNVGYWTGAIIVLGLVQCRRLGSEDFFAHQQYWSQLISPLSNVLKDAKDIVKKFQDATEAASLMDMASHPKEEKPHLHFQSGLVEFCNVGVTFGKKVVLEDFNLVVPAGSKIAIVGPSGVGKSTILALLTGQIEPDTGKILIDGQDITQVKHSSLMRNIGIVEQNYHIFNTTVIDNVRYGKRDASEEEVQNACKKACIHDVIMKREKGYDSPCGDAGNEFSNGERQRIALARLFLMEPDILLIDEGTSALDATTEGSIKRSLSREFKDRTVITVAHRLSSIKAYEIIVIGEKGVHVESGSHDVLLDLKGNYWRYWQEHLGEDVA
ncbi:ATP-binding cassette sub-family B member 6 [Colletotrichum aenigma]|uniref:ATP-binding cassette sub-family B member 6 n=1 Tax=Colletotrichum aenigma TaxID=1215731 RepID=UPI0018721EB0|nr:ATP-binding cassette sub-family B member 6 [Colletotrichum aenigma]KAF5521324.1 ATP-binding cassette sub-family B member 6 [Colletotrichum aenigma]